MFTSLTSITIPDTVTAIDKYAFNYCQSLQSVTIPASVQRSDQPLCIQLNTELKSVTILNPSCVIYSEGKTICNTETGFSGTIIGAAGSTAQTYAEKYHYKFAPAECSRVD